MAIEVEDEVQDEDEDDEEDENEDEDDEYEDENEDGGVHRVTAAEAEKAIAEYHRDIIRKLKTGELNPADPKSMPTMRLQAPDPERAEPYLATNFYLRDVLIVNPLLAYRRLNEFPCATHGWAHARDVKVSSAVRLPLRTVRSFDGSDFDILAYEAQCVSGVIPSQRCGSSS